MQSITQLDIATIRADFPALHQTVYGKPLVYFDNAATSQKPQVVIERIQAYYSQENSNIHRGVHYLSQQATEAYEHTRHLVRTLINAPHLHEVIFTHGTTEGINLVASSFGRKFVQAGDEILISGMEHHSNIVPWQLLCEMTGAHLRVIPVTDAGELDMEALPALLTERTRLVALTWISNSLGTVNPAGEIIRLAHAQNIPVLLDAAQAVPHQAVDVQALDCDFLVFSGHKMFGPTGIGILYGKEKWLDAMPPYMGGGDMIKTVRFEKTTWNDLPFKFEAGTPNIAAGIGLGAAIEYIHTIGYDQIADRENQLLAYGTEVLASIPDLRIIGTAAHKASVISFLIGDIHPYDAGTILDRMGIAIRTGHHCTQPLMERFGIPGTMRASFAFYNTLEEIDLMVEAIHKARQMFG
ncbi:MAG: cysteine desulfurase [Bacteroidia bacterium]|nr:cysteine desulfurase [Bacteroidia bacterium]